MQKRWLNTSQRMQNASMSQMFAEGDDAVVHFSCAQIDKGNFLMRSFTIEIAGQDNMTGTQRIG